jgi:hypothetical protein
MSYVHAGDVSVATGRAAVCPNCERPLTDGMVCWRCCDRLCAGCGRLTGSAFILYCWPCSYRAEVDTAAPKKGGEPLPHGGAGFLGTGSPADSPEDKGRPASRHDGPHSSPPG